MNTIIPNLPRAVALLCLPIAIDSAAHAQQSITALTYQDVVVSAPLIRSGVTSGSGSHEITYSGIERHVTTLVAGGETWAPVFNGVAIARRNTASSSSMQDNPNQSAAWNAVDQISGSDHTVSGRYLNTTDALFTSRNILSGTENLFVNQTTTVHNVASNVERMDFMFSSPFAANHGSAFSVFERGRGPGTTGNGANGGFRIAAITAVDIAGVPSAFSDSILIADDSYNNGGVGVNMTPRNYDVFGFSTSAGPELDYMYNNNIGPQGIAGVLIKTTDLVSSGTPIFGYAVMGEDAPQEASLLVDWNSGWSSNSGMSNDMDMVASGATLYQTVIPEPSSALLVALSAIGLITRRSRQKVA